MGNAARSSAERRQKAELESIDAAVKAHEAAHMAALGSGAASYTYITGPDGTKYAVGGSVPVDLQEVPGNPEATLRKAKAAIRAAFAVGQPSAADMRVAAEAYALEMKAQRELDASRGGEARGDGGAGGGGWWA